MFVISRLILWTIYELFVRIIETIRIIGVSVLIRCPWSGIPLYFNFEQNILSFSCSRLNPKFSRSVAVEETKTICKVIPEKGFYLRSSGNCGLDCCSNYTAGAAPYARWAKLDTQQNLIQNRKEPVIKVQDNSTYQLNCMVIWVGLFLAPYFVTEGGVTNSIKKKMAVDIPFNFAFSPDISPAKSGARGKSSFPGKQVRWPIIF